MFLKNDSYSFKDSCMRVTLWKIRVLRHSICQIPVAHLNFYLDWLSVDVVFDFSISSMLQYLNNPISTRFWSKLGHFLSRSAFSACLRCIVALSKMKTCFLWG